MKSYLQILNQNKHPLHQQPIYLHQTKHHIQLQIPLQYNKAFPTNFFTYPNNIHTYHPATHQEA
ncbi:hypothetical protein, partial [Staphylococcus saprophyticus]|uniref:hypothetical protein n=1 Tax=Staphylococcus saprophyticus TaxID=29385 RepID=UPI00370454CD